ncbi:TonB-dependent receptor [Bacteroides sp. UBA939]|uniref:TonB-dependent receptor n=1 Tax=Bacteroides sp. UBA939 TaxID=1946092 RepID=UPI0025C71B69|nr:TonB-dependent receptor [Bacteroides sp. UBA939]
MKFRFTFIIGLILLCFGQTLFSQNVFRATVKDKETKEALPGVSAYIRPAMIGSTTDANGRVSIQNIPSGAQTLVFSMIGYAEQKLQLTFPLQKDSIYLILLAASESELEEVVVSSTRSSRTISNIPTRIETIASGELEEKAVMQPGNIKMLLTESTGIQVQQTSQVSGSASIRIQGLDGKYTQLLQDGFLLYSGYAEGLSVLQVPPLNLKRVEVVKGSSSTLYGGGAIAGLVNLITKEPEEKREISTLFNTNTTSALDMSAYYSEKYGKAGLTFYTAGNLQKAYDAGDDGLSDIPRFKRLTINPNFFYYFDKNTTLNIGLNAGLETRKGGDMQVIKGNADTEHIYYEQDNTDRYSATAKFNKKFADKSVLTVKGSGGYFKRLIEQNDYDFDGSQFSGFGEASYFIPKEKMDWVFGLNAQTDDFSQSGDIPVTGKLDYTNSVVGLFAQNTWNISQKFIAESGLRLDYTNHNDFFALPRLSFLYKINPHWSSRVGGGLGYKMPTVFSEDSEERAFCNILPLDFDKLKPERSYGVNADVDYKTELFDELSFSINQMFFYTIIQKPLLLNEASGTNYYAFTNADGRIDTKGFETNVKLRYGDFSCYLGYTFTDAVRKFDGTNTINPLTAKHRINANVMYEIEDKLRLSYELFYVSPQSLSTGEQTRGYWIMGASAEYTVLEFLSLFVNFENFTDTRQSRWGDMYTGSIRNPQFAEIYAPTDGFIANAGFRLRF